jgi:glycosyltransferase involved in cell wall biosynthesis
MKGGSQRIRGGDALEVLLFGAWGPQKDTARILSALSALAQKHRWIHLTLAGHINKNFPAYKEELDRIIESLPPGLLTIRDNVSHASEAEVFADSDLVILPYRAAGGWSGVMSVAAFYDRDMICYDLPELQESARSLECQCSFVPGPDLQALESALMAARARNSETARTPSSADRKLDLALVATRRLVRPN